MTDNDMPVELFICYMPTGRGELMRIQATETQTVGSTKYIPEARHKELMERAVGEAFTRGRLHECQDQLWKHVHADSPAATYWAEKVDDLHALLEARAARSTGDDK